MVGRTAELDTLRGWLQAAWRGQGQTILLGGDSGMGKTRLAFEVLRTAAEAGMTTLLGAAYEQEGQWALFNATATFLSGLAAHIPAVLLCNPGRWGQSW